MKKLGVLAVDEGTTGTRATVIDQFGIPYQLNYERLNTNSPRPGVVEQDAQEILDKTVDVMRKSIRDAEGAGIEIVGVSIATQRATVTLWDNQTGKPFGTSMVWQDSRFAPFLAELASEWDGPLAELTGRPVGIRAPYLWASERLKNEPALAAAHASGRLMFGTVDTWLLWNLSNRSQHLSSATNTTPCGGLNIRDYEYFYPWIDKLEFPRDLLPDLVDDAIPHREIDIEIDGKKYPLLALIGDQHASMIGLGTVSTGSTMVMHGTGSFVDLVMGPNMPLSKKEHDGTLGLIGWRIDGNTTYSVETFTAATGSAVDMICDQLGWFESAAEISKFAKESEGSRGITFLPALTGIRSPKMDPNVRGTLSGISTATTKSHIAYAIFEGIAQFVAQSIEVNSAVAQVPVNEVNVGGGLSRADTLMQIQADLVGTPMRRHQNADLAALKGAAFIGAGRGVIWNSLDEAIATLPEGQMFEPTISADERQQSRQLWRDRIDHEIELAEGAVE